MHKREKPAMKRNEDVLYIFLHIPKCAGTTLRYHVENNFPRGECLPLYNSGTNQLTRPLVFDSITSFSQDDRARIRIVYGHEVYYGIHELFDKPARYFTFLRDPIAKTISFYNYRMQQAIRSNTLVEKDMPTFEQWLEASPGMHNGMFGDFVKYGFAETTETDEASMAAIFDKFYFVGTTETFDEDSLFLYHGLGVRRFFRNQNKSTQYLQPNDSVVHGIAEKTELDRKLYGHAQDRNRAFKRQSANFSKIVASMRIKRAVRTYARLALGALAR